MVACFILKEKLSNFWATPLLSAADIKEWMCFKLFKKMTDYEMTTLMYARHVKRQTDINPNYLLGKNFILNGDGIRTLGLTGELLDSKFFLTK